MGLHIIPNNLNINFVGIRKISYVISIILILAGLISLVVKGGPQYGVDFSGGTVAQINFDKAVSDTELKEALKGIELPNLLIQSLGDKGNSYLLRISSQEAEVAKEIRESITDALDKNLPDHTYDIPRMDTVGPKVGADLRSKAVEALYFATLFMSVYISGRFEQRWTIALLMTTVLIGGMYAVEFVMQPFGIDSRIPMVMAAAVLTIILCWKLKLAFAMGAIVSIGHDLLVTVGIFSILNKEFDLTIIAGLLTIVGYSLNDTIIVFDRIRENLRSSKNIPLPTIINRSVNQTLSRTVLTSGTTMFVTLSLFFFGGDAIHDFALIACIGVVVGTLSSIFVASPILLAFNETIMQKVAEDEKKRAEPSRRNIAQV